jgi:hypothetical protein
MKKDRLYIFFIVLLFGLFLLVKLTERQPLNWRLTLDYTSQDPYGTAALYSLLPGIFSTVEVEEKTVYEVKASVKPTDNILLIAEKFDPGLEDIKTLLALADAGSTVFIAAENFSKKLQDTLHFRVYYDFFNYSTFRESDSLYLTFNTALASQSLTKADTTPTDDVRYYFRTINQNNYISRYAPDSARVVTVNENRNINTIRMPFGKGQIFINTTPAIFTNIYLVGNNQPFISALLSVMPANKLIWFERYQIGHRELQTPLRYILTTEPLRWAYYLCMGALLAFIIFEVRRKQRAIPIIKPLVNQSLAFAGTISTLYFQRGDHKNIAEKRIHYFYDYVRTHFYLTGNEPDFIEKLSLKSAKPLVQIESLVNTIVACQQARSMSTAQLSDMNKKIEAFYTKP